jgi:hypothetical protein
MSDKNLVPHSETTLAPVGKFALKNVLRSTQGKIGVLLASAPLWKLAYNAVDAWGNTQTLWQILHSVIGFLGTTWGSIVLMLVGFLLIWWQIYRQQNLIQSKSEPDENDKAKYLEIARELKEFQDSGNKILRKCINDAIPPVAHVLDWEDVVETYIKEKLGEFQAIEFSKIAPVTVYPNDAKHREMANEMYTKLERIGNFISELRPR